MRYFHKGKVLLNTLRYMRDFYLRATDAFFLKIMGRYPVYYFDTVPNVGDMINPYLIRKITNKSCRQVKSRKFKHTVGLGSLFHQANCNSVIWGTGIISNDERYREKTKCHSVRAVRGRLTEDILIENGLVARGQVALGDPGVLMPLYYHPKVEKTAKVGVIPHYVDVDSPFIKGGPDVVILDVRQSPERFIDRLLACSFIVSSSLHGLILADSYGIPNKWVSFSDNITGGSFKYHDYYSTTDNPNESCFFVVDSAKFLELLANIESYASVKRYVFEKNRLIRSFPVF